MTRTIQLEIVNACVAELIPRDSRAYSSTGTNYNPKEHKLRYPVEVLVSIPDTTCLPGRNLSSKTGYVVLSLLSFQPNKRQRNGAGHAVERVTGNTLFIHISHGNFIRKPFNELPHPAGFR